MLTVIMPVYNTASYLEAAVASVLSQTFKELELLLVDDGSTDGSGQLCSRLALQDSRVRVLSGPHRGTAAARNRGLEAAEGALIGFVDADDWIEPDFYALLAGLLAEHQTPMAACGFIKVPEGKPLRFFSGDAPARRLTAEAALELSFLRAPFRFSVCNKLFHRSLFDEVRFTEGQIYEDKGTLYRLIDKAGAVVWCPSPKYHYYMRPGSVMHQDYTRRELTVFQINGELIRFLEVRYPRLAPLAQASYAVECLRLYRRLRHCPTDHEAERRQCLQVLRQLARWVPGSPAVDLKTQLALLVTAYWPNR